MTAKKTTTKAEGRDLLLTRLIGDSTKAGRCAPSSLRRSWRRRASLVAAQPAMNNATTELPAVVVAMRAHAASERLPTLQL
jgi:hypothetical protein